jgi:uncharacterized protein YegP (UPF0339 family)
MSGVRIDHGGNQWQNANCLLVDRKRIGFNEAIPEVDRVPPTDISRSVMSKWIRVTAFTLVAAGLAAVTIPGSVAQDKKKPDDKKPAGKTTGIVEVNEGKDGKFRFIIRDNDEKYIAGSAAFATEKEAKAGLESLKSILENPKMTSKKGEPVKDK